MADEKNRKEDEEMLEDGQMTDDQTNTGSESGEAGKEVAGKTFTQEQVSKMMAREKHQGANSVYKELGLDPKDTKAIDMIKALMASQKTDEQKADEQVKQLAEAERKATLSEAKAEAMMIGVQPQFVDDAVTLALAKMSNEEGADIKTVLGELKTKYPVWFGKAAGQDDEDDAGQKGTKKSEKKSVGQRGTGSSIKTSSGKDKDGEEKNLGARLAAKRRTQSNHKSLWSR